MRFGSALRPWFLLILFSLTFPCPAQNSKPGDSPGSSSSKSKKTPKAPAKASGLEQGGVIGGAYRNKSLGLSVKIPAGWVLRTEEMNARDQEDSDKNAKSSPQGAQRATEEGSGGGRVLLATFSRPPEAKGEDVNASIVIAGEPVSAYPGLTDAAQYLGPLTEVAVAQGFSEVEDPYEIAIGPKTLVRADFRKDVGSRVMRQSTLIFLAKGYAVSITVIAGTDDEVEDLVDGVEFSAK
jgi:hypothetical protein